MIQPSAKKAPPASMAAPQALEYHRAYCRVAYLHCSRSVAGSGISASGGFGNLPVFHPLDRPPFDSPCEIVAGGASPEVGCLCGIFRRRRQAVCLEWHGREDGKGKGASHVRELVSVSRNIMGLSLGLGWVSVENGLVYAFQILGGCIAPSPKEES